VLRLNPEASRWTEYPINTAKPHAIKMRKMIISGSNMLRIEVCVVRRPLRQGRVWRTWLAAAGSNSNVNRLGRMAGREEDCL